MREQTGTLEWLRRAANDPVARHPKHLPESLDFREQADLFLRIYHGAPAEVELGFPLVLDQGRVEAPLELTAQARYEAYLGGRRFLGTFHVHPAASGDRAAPFFDPADLAAALRSDYAGFLELLLARDRLYLLVRANPYLYISAHHVTRNPLLLLEEHQGCLQRAGSRGPDDPRYPAQYRKAGLYWFSRYGMALYEGAADSVLKRTFTPDGTW